MWISGHVCKLLSTSFLNSNSSNWAMFLFVQTPFNAANNQYWGVHYQVLLVWDRNEQGCCKCIHVAVFAIFPTLLSNRHSLSQSASSYTGRCHSIREAIQQCALQIYFLAYTSLFSIKSNILKLQKVYSLSKGLFLGVFLTMVHIHGY